MAKIATVLLSGGIDSAACAHFLKCSGDEVRAIFVDYGQAAAAPEERAAVSLSRRIGIPIELISARSEMSLGAGEIKGRNGFLVLTALCLSQISSGCIILGVHSGTRYYDCSPAFCSIIDRIVAEYTDGSVRVLAPFLNWTKRHILDYYRDSGLPVELAYSCEIGVIPPCGHCLSCQDRRLLACSH
jgi:7-cyano-7-deazaguanine synthase